MLSEIATTVFVSSFLIALIIFFKKFQEIFKLRATVNVIPGPGVIPLIGNVLQLINQNSAQFYQKLVMWSVDYSEQGVYRLWIGPRPVIVVFKAELLESILTNESNTKKSGCVYQRRREFLKDGLSLSCGSKWIKRRKMVSPMFRSSILETFIPVVQLHATKLLESLEKENYAAEINIHAHVAACSLDIICDTALGINVGAQDKKDSALLLAFDRLAYAGSKKVVTPFSTIAAFCEKLSSRSSISGVQGSSKQLVDDFTAENIRRRWGDYGRRITEPQILCLSSDENCPMILQHDVPTMFHNGIPIEELGPVELSTPKKEHLKSRRLAFVDLLIASAKTDDSFTMMDIQEEVNTFIFEGHNNVVSALTWSIFNLALHRDWQKKIRLECERTSQDNRDVMTMEILDELKYTECFIKESLRLFSPVPLIARTLAEDCQIGGYRVPKGVSLFILLAQVQRDAKHFPDPDKFDPERWVSDDVTKRHPFSYLPFSAGVRNCIGERFAMWEMKVILSSITLSFDISLVDKDNLTSGSANQRLTPDPTNREPAGLRVKLTKLSKERVI